MGAGTGVGPQRLGRGLHGTSDSLRGSQESSRLLVYHLLAAPLPQGSMPSSFQPGCAPTSGGPKAGRSRRPRVTPQVPHGVGEELTIPENLAAPVRAGEASRPELTTANHSTERSARDAVKAALGRKRWSVRQVIENPTQRLPARRSHRTRNRLRPLSRALEKWGPIERL